MTTEYEKGNVFYMKEIYHYDPNLKIHFATKTNLLKFKLPATKDLESEIIGFKLTKEQAIVLKELLNERIK